MRARAVAAAVLVFTMYGCATSAPVPARQPDVLRGMASWYGEEFAGRTTANGEIFDPMGLTAAHRTLPFGTVLDVLNPKTGKTVRVRINDRGPFVGNRAIDLSYAAAQQVGLVEPGTGEVEMRVVTVGRGDREPPAPLVVNVEPVAPAPPTQAAGDPPAVAFPLPAAVTPDSDFGVSVTEQRAGVMTRRVVAADGTSIQEVPVDAETAAATAPPAESLDRQTLARKTAERKAPKRVPQFVVQLGAFAVEANAVALRDRATRVGQQAHVDREDLYRVRIGPFPTRDEAVKVRSALETSGMSAIIVVE